MPSHVVLVHVPVSIKVLPTKRQGRPLLVAQKLDETIQGFIKEARKAGGVINTSVVVAMAMGIITSKDPSLLHENGGHLVITSSWAKSILKRMGYVKRKSSSAGKVTVEDFEELKVVFLEDIKAEVFVKS